MKNKSFIKRFTTAWYGIAHSFRTEASFKTQVAVGILIYLLLAILRPDPVWWALVTISVSMVLTAELLNTALEHLCDRLGRTFDPLIKSAKDAAAGAVLLSSLFSVVVFVVMIIDLWNQKRIPFLDN